MINNNNNNNNNDNSNNNGNNNDNSTCLLYYIILYYIMLYFDLKQNIIKCNIMFLYKYKLIVNKVEKYNYILYLFLILLILKT